MQNSVTVETQFSPIKETRHGAPWDVRGYAEDARLADERGGFFDLTQWGTVTIQGPDARDYLNRMTTLNFKNFSDDSTAYGAFLTGRAGVVTLGIFLQTAADSFDYLVAPGKSAAVAEHIEKFHFRENLTVTDESARWAYFGLWNTNPLQTPTEVPVLQRIRDEYGEALAWRDQARERLVWVRVARENAPAFLAWLRTQDVLLLGQHLFEYHRLKSGIPNVGEEVTDKDLILEANLELAISRNKGCYPGQEVVERIFTYGQVNRKLLPVAVSGAFPALPFVVKLGDKKAGTVVALMESPAGQGAIGLAYIQRSFWESTETFISEDGRTQVRVQR